MVTSFFHIWTYQQQFPKKYRIGDKNVGIK